MALINCRECGKEISDQAKVCPNCGCPVKREKAKLNINLNKYRKLAVPALVIVVILIAVLIVSGSLNADEQYAYERAVELKSILKNPSAFKLGDEIIILKSHNDEGELTATYTIIEYSGTNGYGATITDHAIFKNGKYIMDYSEEPSVNSKNGSEKIQVKFAIGVGMRAGYNDENWVRLDIKASMIRNKVR